MIPRPPALSRLKSSITRRSALPDPQCQFSPPTLSSGRALSSVTSFAVSTNPFVPSHLCRPVTMFSLSRPASLLPDSPCIVRRLKHENGRYSSIHTQFSKPHNPLSHSPLSRLRCGGDGAMCVIPHQTRSLLATSFPLFPFHSCIFLQML